MSDLLFPIIVLLVSAGVLQFTGRQKWTGWTLFLISTPVIYAVVISCCEVLCCMVTGESITSALDCLIMRQ